MLRIIALSNELKLSRMNDFFLCVKIYRAIDNKPSMN